MMTWALVVAFQDEANPSVYLKASEQECRFMQWAVTSEAKRTERSVEAACYVITPTPKPVTHRKATPLK